MKFINVFYQANILSIGGVETFLYELARLANENNRDLTIMYKIGDNEQIRRLEKYCRVLHIDSVEKPIRCKKAFFNYNLDAITYFEADEYVQLIHADFKDKSLKNYKLIQSDKIDTYYAVSKNNAKSFRELTGKDITVLYNPISIDTEPKVMTLISAQRLSPEKGGKRLEKLATALDNAHIPYVWHIFSTDRLNVRSDNIMYHPPTLDIRRWIKYADYMVLLSDTEGYSYGAYESLCLGTPLIITRLPVLDELNVNDLNSIVLDFDLSNMDVYEIYNRAGTFRFNYSKKSNEWLNILKGESTYTAPLYMCIKALKPYYDTVINRIIHEDEVYEVTSDRADTIIANGLAVIDKE